jgi:D-psicose/D-tagatose/L-ribulose 3-epimerase
MPFPFRYSICNEIFERIPFHKACQAAQSAGYTGIEIAPFTLSPNPAALSYADRKQYRSAMDSEGLRFAGLHWLMVAPEGLHVTTPDPELRARSWQHINDLIDLCADLGDNGVMVFGSPKQRSTTAGSTVEDATKRMEDGLAAISGHAMERGVTVLLEALPRSQSDVVTTLGEAVRIVRRINSPAIRTMFDTHNAEDETESHAEVLNRYFEYIQHVHVNEMDGRHPGTGGYDFGAILKVLKQRNYSGWISLEVFDFSAGADNIARQSLSYLQSVAEKTDE